MNTNIYITYLQTDSPIRYYIFPNTNNFMQEPVLTLNESDFLIIKNCFLKVNNSIIFTEYTDFSKVESFLIISNIKTLITSSNNKDLQVFLTKVSNFIESINIQFNGITLDSNL